MTVSYSLDVSKARFCGFTKLLARWRGGIYKILWREFTMFCIAYAFLSLTYRHWLSEEQKLVFEKVVIFVGTFTDSIPLSFVLGFYVSLVIGRWWGQYETIPWPDRLCFLIASYVHGSDDRSRMIRRTLGRYVILAQVLTFQAVSTAVKRRFPTTQHLVAAGIMTKEEKSVHDKISFNHGKWWLPSHWFTALTTRARKEGRIKDSVLLNALNREMLDYRTSCAIMFGYDWISVPLVYTQVVTIATYVYCLALIIGKQFLDPAKGYPNNDIDLYVPFFTLLQFFFYVGWLKVAEQILNPYGEDDDDFELNWCLDRTVHLVYLVVDKLQLKHPRVTKDFFWDEMDIILPQTKHSASFPFQPPLGSAYSLNVEEAEYIPLEALLENDAEENLYKSDSVKRRDELRPSLIRRMLSSGFGQSRLRRVLSRETSSNTSSNSQGYYNPTFEVNNEKNIGLSRQKSTPSPTTNLNNTVTTSPPHSRKTTVSFRPNSLSLHRRKTYHLKDAEKMNRHSNPTPSTDSANSNAIPVSRTKSAPPVSNIQNYPLLESDDDEDDFLETDMEEPKMDSLMPAIPEETSRAASLASIEAGSLKVSQKEEIEDNNHKTDTLKPCKEEHGNFNAVSESESQDSNLKAVSATACRRKNGSVKVDTNEESENMREDQSFRTDEFLKTSKRERKSGKAGLNGEAWNLKANSSDFDSPMQIIHNVHHLVNEANKVLEELHRSVSSEGHGRDFGIRGYESCCSQNHEDSSSVESESDELENLKDNTEKMVVIDIDRDEQHSQTVNGGLESNRH